MLPPNSKDCHPFLATASLSHYHCQGRRITSCLSVLLLKPNLVPFAVGNIQRPRHSRALGLLLANRAQSDALALGRRGPMATPDGQLHAAVRVVAIRGDVLEVPADDAPRVR